MSFNGTRKLKFPSWLSFYLYINFSKFRINIIFLKEFHNLQLCDKRATVINKRNDTEREPVPFSEAGEKSSACTTLQFLLLFKRGFFLSSRRNAKGYR